MPSPSRITRSPRRRRTVALRVLPDGTLTVQAPLRTSLKWIEGFIASRAKWIERRVAEATRKRTAPSVTLETGALIPYEGRFLLLNISSFRTSAAPKARREDPESRLVENHVIVSLPDDLPPQDRQAEIRTELILWYKKQARRVFAERLAFWAERMNLKPSRLIISSPARRWGSCNAKNEIRLNWRLVMASPEILDYVIVHELAHIPHKNHSTAFWRCVARAVPDCKEKRKTLHNWNGAEWLS